MQRTVQKDNLAVGILLVLPLMIGYLMLNALGTATSFNALVVFFIIGGWSFIAAALAYSLKITPFEWLRGKFTLGDLGYIAIGFVGLIAIVSMITGQIAGSPGIILALFVGGILLAVCLFRTKNILVPIAIHGFYNTFVILASAGVFGSVIPAASINPAQYGTTLFNFGTLTPQDVVNQSLTQWVATATGEELVKVSAALGISVLLVNNKYVAMGIAVFGWAALHSVASYPLSLNLGSLLPH